MSYRAILRTELQTFKIELADQQVDQLAVYCGEVDRWNKKINLTSLTGLELVRRLVVEPVWIGLQLKPSGVLLDIGSGNGSPAIPLAVVCDFLQCHLVEARTKRAVFLRHVKSMLGMSGVVVHPDRFEDCAAGIEQPDWVTLQAVALTGKLLGSIRAIAIKTTNVVWITSSKGIETVVKARTELEVPITRTRVFVLSMDLF